MAATDLLTLDEAHRAINLDESVGTHDDELATVISGVSGVIDDECGAVVARTVTARLPVLDTGRVSFGVPVYSLTSVGSRYGSTTTSLTIETDVVFPASGVLLVDGGTVNAHLLSRSSGVTGTFGSGADLIVVYQAGRCASTATVPAKFKQAAMTIVAAHWRMWAPSWARTPQFTAETDEFSPAAPPAEMVRAMLPRELLLPGIG